MAQITHFKVRNWEQFQHYKDRNPPWIKLHFALLASEDWVTLDDASKLLAVVCMLIASRNNGLVPNNPAYLQRVAYLNRVPKLNPLIDCGFLQNPQADASEMQAHDSTPQADARPETETETETETDKKDSLSETSSDGSKKSRRRESYPDDFEAFWSNYPRTLNMSKKEAFDEWKKLDPSDRLKCATSVEGYKAFLNGKPEHEIIHACRFISKRRFEGFAQQDIQALGPADDDVWQSRLRYGRRAQKWSIAEWGPVPGGDFCRAPPHLLQPGDGEGWAEMEIAR